MDLMSGGAAQQNSIALLGKGEQKTRARYAGSRLGGDRVLQEPLFHNASGIVASPRAIVQAQNFAFIQLATVGRVLTVRAMHQWQRRFDRPLPH